MPFRILIVDDEPRQRKGLARLVASLRPNWEVFEAGNGQGALGIARRERPHAVISDIRMPMMDGLTLVEQLRMEQPDIVSAYISAYQDFDYAAQALRLGAVDYLVKPYTREQVEQLLARLEKRMLGNRAHATLSDTLDHTLRAFREQLALALVNRPLSGDEYAQLNAYLPLASGGYLAVLQLMTDFDGDWSGEDVAELLPQLRAWTETVFPQMQACELGGEQAGLVFLIPGNNQTPESIEWQLRALADSLANDFSIDLVMALSDRMESIAEGAQPALRQARAAAGFRFYQDSPRFIPYSQVREALTRELPYLFTYEHALRQAVLAADEADCAKAAYALVDATGKDGPYPPEKVIRRVYQVAQSMILAIEGRLPGAVFNQLWADCAAVFSQISSFVQLREDFSQLMRTVAVVQLMDNGLRKEAHVREVIDYIGRNIEKPLTLSALAAQFYFSPNYLSAMIKSRTSLSFKPYLLKLRMDKSAQLLIERDDKVVEIAQQVGILDPTYFNRVFKKTFGVSPDTYRRNMRPAAPKEPIV